MVLLPPRKRAAQALGLMLMFAGCLSVLELVFVERYYGHVGPPKWIVVLGWARLICTILAIWGGNRLLTWGMRPSQPAAREQQAR